MRVSLAFWSVVLFALVAVASAGDLEDASSRGMELAQAGKLKQALLWFKKSEKLAPTSSTVHNNLALTYYHLGEYHDSIKHYKKALAFDPENDQADIQRTNIRELSKLLEDEFDEDDVEEEDGWDEEEDDVVSDEDDVVSDEDYEDEFGDDDDEDEGWDDWEDEEEESAGGNDGFSNLAPGERPVDVAIRLASQERFEEALIWFERSEKENPHVWTSHNNLAMVYLQLHRNFEALQHYKKALELDPNNEQEHIQRKNVEALSDLLGLSELDLEAMTDENPEEDDDDEPLEDDEDYFDDDEL